MTTNELKAVPQNAMVALARWWDRAAGAGDRGEAARAISRSDLPRDEPRQSAGTNFSGCSRSAEVLGNCQKTDWQVHAYCLMNNHFHGVLETPLANLVRGMRWVWLGDEERRAMRRQASASCSSSRKENMPICGTDPFDGHELLHATIRALFAPCKPTK
jgi:hypothetical protein